MDASCKIQGSIHVFRLVNNMCPGKWVHIIFGGAFTFVDDIGIINVILFVLYVLSWHAIRETTEDFIRNGGGEGCDFKGRDAFMTLRTQ